jgi:transcriptional regulator with XRE-family HTH domain
MTTAGMRIKRRRKELGIKQNELAHAVGISQSSLSELETGESKLPSAEILLKLSSALGISPTWIVTGQEGQMDVLTPDEQEFFSAARTLTPEQRSAVFTLIRSFTKP